MKESTIHGLAISIFFGIFVLTFVVAMTNVSEMYYLVSVPMLGSLWVLAYIKQRQISSNSNTTGKLWQEQTSFQASAGMIVKSGERVTVAGFYKLVNHDQKCFITTMSSRMFFKKGEEAPMTGSCDHVADWEFIEPMDSV